MKQNLNPLIALAVLILISSISFAGTPNLTAEKFTKASEELKKEQSNLNLIKKTPNQKENKLDLKSKANELGLSEQQLTAILKNTGRDSNQVDALSSSVLTGQHSQDYFGYSVSKTGDINGDGYGDFIVGSPQNNTVGTMAGKVVVYFGGTNIDLSPDIILSASASGDYFGCSVSDAGDLNGDGFADFIVGAEYADGPATNIGKAYIYFGGNVISNTPALTLTGLASNDYFGISVACAGDVNGDGYSDVIVGATYNDAGATNSGAAFIFYGGVNMNNVADVTLAGASANDALGYSVAGVGDVNGDGYSDVIVSAVYNDAGAIDAGRVYIYYGGSAMNNTADLILTGTTAGGGFGNSVSGAGDVNADGYEDFIIGEPFNNAAGTYAGRAYLYFGGAAPDNTADVTFTGQAAGDEFGYSVSSAGDVNCDGFLDVIIGAPYSDLSGTDYGSACVYFGGTSIDNISDIIVSGVNSNYEFGSSVSQAGDLNGDGIADFIVGAPATSVSTGKAYFYTNSMTGNDIADFRQAGPSPGTSYGRFVSSAGDVNGDGYDDYMVGEPFAGTNSQGSIRIFYGGTNIHYTPDIKLNGQFIDAKIGYFLAPAGDVNGDGYGDIITGDPYHDQGLAFIYFGGANMDTVADVSMTGISLGDYLGFSVSSAGDVNGDGFDDVIVGVKGQGPNPIKANIYFGGRTMDNVADVVLKEYHNSSDAYVASAGDVNNDGYSDVIVGSRSFNSNGQAFLCYGGVEMDTTKDVIFYGASSLDLFGFSVASGDFNNDGYSDILIGAPHNDDAGTSAGKVYLYYGSASMDNIADAVFPGKEAGQNFGNSVACAGDVNHDGYQDFVVGAPSSAKGNAYVYFGANYISTTQTINMVGAYAGESFGTVVNCAGDINGDGLSDIIVGSPDYNSFQGAFSLFLSSSTPVVPRILKVSDVLLDQGGSVILKFQRSGFDVIGQNKITGYYIEKSPPPGVSGFAWGPVTTISPTHNSLYSFTADTWGDSSSNGAHKIYFRVTAQTSNVSEYWRSNIMYGQSIDNLSPAAPAGLAAAPNSTRINLSWTANTEPDMKDYLIYRNGVNISSANSISFTDTTAVQDSIYIYKIAARDIHGNISPLSAADTASLEAITTINVTVIPEGLLNPGTNQLRMRDTVKAKLWDLTGSYIVDSATAVIDSVTFIASFTFKNAPTGSYYLAISHRNSIETWSKTGGESYTRGTITSYDFTSANSQAFGNNLKLKGGRYCMYTGDVNQSGVINSTDRTLIRSNVGQTGYIKYDLDGNGVVNSADRTIVRNNTGVARQRP